MRYLILLLFLAGCQPYYVSVKKDYIDRRSLASTFVGSPDPRQKDPDRGQSLIVRWNLPEEELKKDLTLKLEMLFHNLEQETLCVRIKERRGLEVFKLLNERYRETGGLLTYRAEIVDDEGNVVQEWKQRLWTEVITIESPGSLPTSAGEHVQGASESHPNLNRDL